MIIVCPSCQARYKFDESKLKGGKATQTVSLEPKDFGEGLSSWKNVDLLGLRAYFDKGGKLLGSKSWAGGQPRFRNLRWQGNER